MTREEFDTMVPPIDRAEIPPVPPEIYRIKMAEDPDNIPMSVAAVMLLKGMGDLGARLKIMKCFAMTSVALQSALKADPYWPDMDFDEQVAFAVDAIREKLWEFLTQDDEGP